MKHLLLTSFFGLFFSLAMLAQSGPSTSYTDFDSPKLEFSVYPNPAVDFIQLSGPTSQVRSIAIYSMVGRSVKQFSAAPNDRYNVADLPNGMYLVQMLDAKQNIIHTHRMNKRG